MSSFKNTFVYKVLRYLLGPIWHPLRIKYLQNRYKKHSFEKTLCWNWSDTHFNRIALVNLLVSQVSDCKYLEIGCASNDLFDSVFVLDKVGVDPQQGGTIRKISDDFFEENKSFFDVIFIDGLHSYEQVRKDVINSIKFLKPGGWVALHDMIPRSWIEHHVPIVSPGSWTGDVWKVAFELSKTPGIDFKILKIDHGVGVFKLTQPNPTLVDLTAELNDKEFAYFYENISKLPMEEWNKAQEATRWAVIGLTIIIVGGNLLHFDEYLAAPHLH